MDTIKKVIKRGDLSKIHIPEDFGEEIEVTIKSHIRTKTTPRKGKLTEDELYLIQNNNLVIEDNPNEDKIWSKYL
jgi:hypothetical protein